MVSGYTCVVERPTSAQIDHPVDRALLQAVGGGVVRVPLQRVHEVRRGCVLTVPVLVSLVRFRQTLALGRERGGR